MSEEHLSSSFDADLNLVSARLLEMGGLVESQIAHALDLLDAFDYEVVRQDPESEGPLKRLSNPAPLLRPGYGRRQHAASPEPCVVGPAAIADCLNARAVFVQRIDRNI